MNDNRELSVKRSFSSRSHLILLYLSPATKSWGCNESSNQPVTFHEPSSLLVAKQHSEIRTGLDEGAIELILSLPGRLVPPHRRRVDRVSLGEIFAE